MANKHKQCLESCSFKRNLNHTNGGTLIRCTICANWYHALCTKVPESETAGSWTCPPCRDVFFSMEIVRTEVFRISNICEDISNKLNNHGDISASLHRQNIEIQQLNCSLEILEKRLAEKTDEAEALRAALSESNSVIESLRTQPVSSNQSTYQPTTLAANINTIPKYPRSTSTAPPQIPTYSSALRSFNQTTDRREAARPFKEPQPRSQRIGLAPDSRQIHRDVTKSATTHHSRPKPKVTIGTAHSSDSDLTVVDAPQHKKPTRINAIFVSRFAPTTTCTDVAAWFTERTTKSAHVERLQSRYDTYASFRIYSTDATQEEMLCPEAWPNGTLIMPSSVPLQSRNNIRDTLSSLQLRDATEDTPLRGETYQSEAVRNSTESLETSIQ